MQNVKAYHKVYFKKPQEVERCQMCKYFLIITNCNYLWDILYRSRLSKQNLRNVIKRMPDTIVSWQKETYNFDSQT